MTMYAGDEYYDDDVTSGPIDSGWQDDGRYDDDPSPYDGNYSEE
jgi:hypothetical protein